MVTTVERQQLRTELVSQGYSWDYIDSWQPKITLYRHAPGLDIEGNVATPVGTAMPGVPGNPDYVARKSRLGMLPGPPSDSCECRWCAGRRTTVDPEPVVEEVTEPSVAVDEASSLNTVSCPDCGLVISARSGANALSRLRAHSKTHE
jgi:hypothetical protein